MRFAITAVSTLALTVAASAQIVPGDSFDLDLSVTNDTDGELLVSDNFVFGVDTDVPDTGFGSLRVRTEQTDLTAGDYTASLIVEALDGTIPPAGSTFGGSPATDFILALGSLNPLGNGFDFVTPISVIDVQGFVTVSSDPGTLIGPFTTDAIEFGLSPDMQEIRYDFGLGSSGPDLADESVQSILVIVRYSAVPEPTSLASLAAAGLFLRRRR